MPVWSVAAIVVLILSGALVPPAFGRDAAPKAEVPSWLEQKIGGLSESIDVVTSASTIDLTSPSTETSISQDLLGSMPLNIGKFNGLLNFMSKMSSQLKSAPTGR